MLRQKLDLLQVLHDKHANSNELFQTPCPIVKASVGQHMRHSVDHIQRAVKAGGQLLHNTDQNHSRDPLVIHYDLRERGGSDERDIDAARDRIWKVEEELLVLDNFLNKHSSEPSTIDSRLAQPLHACFMLLGNSEQEYPLSSTLARELGFAVHHAIHHMAMVRVIVTAPSISTESPLFGWSDEDVPADFGRAPSTINHDHAHAEQ